MTAVQQRELCSSASHRTQEYWTSPLSKCSQSDSNSYVEKYHKKFVIHFPVTCACLVIKELTEQYKSLNAWLPLICVISFSSVYIHKHGLWAGICSQIVCDCLSFILVAAFSLVHRSKEHGHKYCMLTNTCLSLCTMHSLNRIMSSK